MTARIGVAGWSLRREQQALFGEGVSHLARYATQLNAVEINSSFYRPAASVPANFRFSAKLPRAITHNARLENVEKPLAEFLEEVGGLGDRLGPLLVQLPPSLVFNAQIAADFFANLRAGFSGLLACEPRHGSWFVASAEALLKKHHVARVAADPAPAPGADRPGGWRGFAYFRWHGSPVMYRSNYSVARLAALAAQLKQDDWCIFDNTADGAATPNALSLKERV
jgi:uncharacterized protein YecE (DUF72 family)